MPLTAKGEAILHHLTQEYGPDKAKQVLYAGQNSGRFTGIDSVGHRLDVIMADCARLSARMDALVEGKKTPEEPYGTQNEYADPGYQADKKKRYPLGSEEEIRAAWNYVHKSRDADKYSPEHLKTIKARIVKAWREKIGKDGPPEASER